MDLVSTKLVVAVVFAIIRIFFGLLPIKIYKILKIWEKEDEGAAFINEKRHKQVNCWLALFQSFGGGVLFATCFLHMIPEVHKSVQFLIKDNDLEITYPFSQVIVSTGFFLVYFVEEISHWLITKMGRETRKNFNKQRTLKENRIHPEDIRHTQDKTSFVDNDNNKTRQEEELKRLEDTVYIINGDSEKNIEHEDKVYIIGCEDDVEMNNKKNLELQENNRNLVLDDNSTLEEEVEQLEIMLEKQEKDQQQILRCCLMVVALSLHAFFEGLAIGLQISVSNIWYLFTAISIHSATILFCIGLELLIAKTKTKVIVLNIIILSVTSPFGVILGLVITLYADMNTTAKSLAVILLEGLSAGTILYITFFEVLNREKARRVIILTRACFILAGFTLMAMLEYVELGK